MLLFPATFNVNQQALAGCLFPSISTAFEIVVMYS
jgi:hypothetical protein